ncbi:hypothetical protein ACFC96_42235 [Streptomyces sp. NPDC055955]|uniref:hypothetical protein n=1 Tax=Streptomyces sp. NPDC055955 TaxID=3345665 RepID=UPI0035DE99F9
MTCFTRARAARRREDLRHARSAPLAGRTVLISGSSRDLGLATALRDARDGTQVALLAKDGPPRPAPARHRSQRGPPDRGGGGAHHEPPVPAPELALRPA